MASGIQLAAPQNSRKADTEHSHSRLRISGDTIGLVVEQGEPQIQLVDATIEGGVRCQTYDARRGQPTADDAELTGTKLVMRNFSKSSGRATITGSPAHVRVRKSHIRGPVINVDRGNNRVWIDGPGTAILPLPEQIAVRYPSEKAFADIRWNESLQFDGRIIQCQRQVDVRGPAQLVRADQVAIQLTRSVDLTQLDLRAAPVGLQQLDGIGNVHVEHRTLGNGGIESIDSARLQQLTYVHATGELVGAGPGWLETTRRDNGALGPLGRRAAVSTGLVYLRVEFQQQVLANTRQRLATFRGGVSGIFGPVSDWSQQLDVDTVRPRPNELVMHADELRIMQIQQAAGVAPIELQAIGNTALESAEFAAQAHVLKYEQRKGMFSLEGKGRSLAKLWRTVSPGSPRKQELVARSIGFWPTKNRVKVDGVQELNFDIGGTRQARR